LAAIDNVVEKEIKGVFGLKVLRGQLTGATSTYKSTFGKVFAVIAQVEGTNSFTWTRSGVTITMTGTNDDYVNLAIFGE
jgi:hypothetical protein